MPARVETFRPAVLLVVCAWCSLLMGRKECAPEQDGQTSHSICPTCLVAMEQQVA